MEKKAYSVKETAAILGIGVNSAYSLINRADFPKIRIGKRYIIPARAFDEWLNNNALGGAE